MPALTGGEYPPHTVFPDNLMIASIILMAALVALSTIDLFYQRLPNALTRPLMAAGLLFTAVFQWGELPLRVAAAVLAYGLMYLIAVGYEWLRGHPGLGLGDAKLMAAAGAWLGFAGLPAVLLLATGSALVCILLAAAFGKQMTLATRIPLGPFLALGFWIVWLYGPID